ncbi:unnamed protein product [Fasciola hepatica]|uniref:Uncharacterized protein n=1 Tax=Fasciola hepatica TaxID=6192 RepID=A0ABC9HI91_FASHE
MPPCCILWLFISFLSTEVRSDNDLTEKIVTLKNNYQVMIQKWTAFHQLAIVNHLSLDIIRLYSTTLNDQLREITQAQLVLKNSRPMIKTVLLASRQIEESMINGMYDPRGAEGTLSLSFRDVLPIADQLINMIEVILHKMDLAATDLNYPFRGFR